MADYYPLLARALDALPDRTPALRKAVYDRARNALISQLRSLDPPLSEDDIDTERRALDAAIERLEVDHGGLPAPANDAASARGDGTHPTPGPAIPEPTLPESAVPEPVVHDPGAPEPALPAATAPFVPRDEPPVIAPEPREAPIPIAPRRPGMVQPAALEPGETAQLPVPAEDPDLAAVELGSGRQRPRIEVVPPRAGRSKVLRNIFVGGVLAVVIAMIAVAAFLLRDRPQILPSSGTDTAETRQPESETKFGDRVGGEAAPAPRTVPRPDSSPPPRAAVPSGEPTVSVAQRAELIEETTGGENAQPTLQTGRVTWRLDSVNGGQGQPLQTAVVATVTIPDAALTLTMTIQRNLDSTLPASHTVNLTFTQTGTDGGVRTIQDVGLLQAKDDQNARGSPVSGLPVRVRDNLFLIGLSSLPNDVERNTDLLLHKNWFDLALRYTSGRRAVLTFEKGSTGAQVMQKAFDAWQ